MKSLFGAIIGAAIGIIAMLFLATFLIVAGFDLTGGLGFLVGFAPPFVLGVVGLVLGADA